MTAKDNLSRHLPPSARPTPAQSAGSSPVSESQTPGKVGPSLLTGLVTHQVVSARDQEFDIKTVDCPAGHYLTMVTKLGALLLLWQVNVRPIFLSSVYFISKERNIGGV